MKKRITAFDFVRILAMLLIVCYHWNTYCYIYLINTPELLPFPVTNGNIGTIGVSLFFVLSGASLMYVYRARFEFRTYLRHRFLSIYPAYWLTYILMFLYVHVLRKRTIHGEFWTWILTFLGLDGLLNGYLPVIYLIGEWFTGCIVCLYLLFPLLLRAVRKYPKGTAAAGILLAAAGIFAEPYIPLGDHFPLLRVPEMLFGMYYVKMCCPEEKTEDSPAKALRFRVPLFAGLAVFAAMCLVRIELPLLLTDYLLGISAFCVLTGFWSLLPEHDGVRRALAAAAGYTYEIFLIHHVPIGEFLRKMDAETVPFAGEMLRFCAYLASVIAAAVAVTQLQRFLLRVLSKDSA